MSPTLSPSPAHRPHHLPGRPPDLCGSSSRPMPCTCSPCGRLTIRTAGNPPRSEKEAFPVTKKYLLNAHEVLGAVGTWGNTLSPRSQEMPARQVRSREARSLAHGHPRWQWQSQVLHSRAGHSQIRLPLMTAEGQASCPLSGSIPDYFSPGLPMPPKHITVLFPSH